MTILVEAVASLLITVGTTKFRILKFHSCNELPYPGTQQKASVIDPLHKEKCSTSPTLVGQQ